MGKTFTTNASLAKIVSTHIIHDDFNELKSITQTNANIIEAILSGTTSISQPVTTIATNATVINTAKARICRYACTSLASSLTTITGMTTGVPFTIMVVAAASFGNHTLCDVSPFLLAGDWSPTTAGSNITLVWDGTNYTEIGRIAP